MVTYYITIIYINIVNKLIIKSMNYFFKLLLVDVRFKNVGTIILIICCMSYAGIFIVFSTLVSKFKDDKLNCTLFKIYFLKLHYSYF